MESSPEARRVITKTTKRIGLATAAVATAIAANFGVSPPDASAETPKPPIISPTASKTSTRTLTPDPTIAAINAEIDADIARNKAKLRVESTPTPRGKTIEEINAEIDADIARDKGATPPSRRAVVPPTAEAPRPSSTPATPTIAPEAQGPGIREIPSNIVRDVQERASGLVTVEADGRRVVKRGALLASILAVISALTAVGIRLKTAGKDAVKGDFRKIWQGIKLTVKGIGEVYKYGWKGIKLVWEIRPFKPKPRTRRFPDINLLDYRKYGNEETSWDEVIDSMRHDRGDRI